MPALPFQLPLLQLELLEAVRILPQRRYVCRGRLGEQDIYVKFFTGKNASTYFEREKTGVETLHKNTFNGPQILKQGTLSSQELPSEWELQDSEVSFIIYKAIDAPSALSLWRSGDTTQRKKLIQRFIPLLAQYHSAGFYQSDIHLGNFLVSDSKIYCLDGDGIKNFDPKNQTPALENLALFCAQAGFHFPLSQIELSELYPKLPSDFAQNLQSQRQRRIQKLGSKVLRNCTAVEHVQSKQAELYINRELDSPALRELLEDPSKALETGRATMLKDGNTCTVYSTQIDQQTVIIKRYNPRPGLKGKLDTLRRGRSRNCWSSSFILEDNGLYCPKAIACIVQKDGLKRTDYFIAQEAQGVLLSDYVTDNEKAQIIAPKVHQLFQAMQQGKMTHGDFKATNFFVTQADEIEIIDLDSLRFHSNETKFLKDFQKDLKRFHKNWSDQISETFKDALSEFQ